MSSPDVTRLYVALGRLNRTLRREVPDATVGHGALSALATLVDGGPLRAGALAEAEGISAPSMTRILASLEQLGHLRRTPDPDDGRAQLVAATDSGARLVTEGRSRRLVALARRMEGLDASTREQLLAALPALERLSAPDA